LCCQFAGVTIIQCMVITMVITEYPSRAAAFLSDSCQLIGAQVSRQEQGDMERLAPRHHEGMGVRHSTVKQVQAAGDWTRVGGVRHNFAAPG
jgi:hypothetical protein